MLCSSCSAQVEINTRCNLCFHVCFHFETFILCLKIEAYPPNSSCSESCSTLWFRRWRSFLNTLIFPGQFWPLHYHQGHDPVIHFIFHCKLNLSHNRNSVSDACQKMQTHARSFPCSLRCSTSDTGVSESRCAFTDFPLGPSGCKFHFLCLELWTVNQPLLFMSHLMSITLSLQTDLFCTFSHSASYPFIFPVIGSFADKIHFKFVSVFCGTHL